jgi:hypothetical protein
MFFGDPPDIAGRLSSIKHMNGRRLFHVLVGSGNDYQIYEYERKRRTLYSVRSAALDASAANELLSEFPRIALENKGRRCAGRLFQDLPVFKSLQFTPVGEEELADPEESLKKLITTGTENQSSPEEGDEFHRVAVVAEC